MDPSRSAEMICAPEAAADITKVVGLEPIRPLAPTWVDHVYACDYSYAVDETMGLSVKELSSAAETKVYFDSQAQVLGRTKTLVNVGEDAYATSTGSAVVRKDYKVLIVDVSRLPERFGKPVGSRASIATAVAMTVLRCWTGD
ncbi:MAG: hypothetical protein U0Q22_06090 [Acidimicrobiales bacterium]